MSASRSMIDSNGGSAPDFAMTTPPARPTTRPAATRNTDFIRCAPGRVPALDSAVNRTRHQARGTLHLTRNTFVIVLGAETLEQLDGLRVRLRALHGPVREI